MGTTIALGLVSGYILRFATEKFLKLALKKTVKVKEKILENPAENPAKGEYKQLENLFCYSGNLRGQKPLEN